VRTALTCRPLNSGLCGKSEPTKRPTRWPRRVLKLLRISSGMWSLGLPECGMAVPGTTFVTLKNAVGP
jgi:hypothetical protein